MRSALAESRLLAAVATLAAVLAIAPAPANADVGEAILLRCTHNESLAGFKPSDYKKALKEATADAEEYTECGAQIRRAEEAAAGGSSGGSGPGGGATGTTAPLAASPSEQTEIARAAQDGAGSVRLDGGSVRPGVVHANVSSAFSTLPSPILATLAVALAALLTLGGRALATRVRNRDA
jgi:hypothetical protein